MICQCYTSGAQQSITTNKHLSFTSDIVCFVRRSPWSLFHSRRPSIIHQAHLTHEHFGLHCPKGSQSDRADTHLISLRQQQLGKVRTVLVAYTQKQSPTENIGHGRSSSQISSIWNWAIPGRWYPSSGRPSWPRLPSPKAAIVQLAATTECLWSRVSQGCLYAVKTRAESETKSTRRPTTRRRFEGDKSTTTWMAYEWLCCPANEGKGSIGWPATRAPIATRSLRY